MSYTKLAASIITSTVWQEDDHTRILWFTLMALADKNGEVQGSIPGLAHIARIPIESCEAALEKFHSPDPYSRTKTDEGRRLETIEGGWFLINHDKHRKLASDIDRAEKAAIRQKRFRERNDRNAKVTQCNATVTPDSTSRSKSSNSNTKANLNPSGISSENRVTKKRFSPPSREELDEYGAEIGIDFNELDKFVDFYSSKGWLVGKAKMKCWKAALRNWKRNGNQFGKPSQTSNDRDKYTY